MVRTRSQEEPDERPIGIRIFHNPPRSPSATTTTQARTTEERGEIMVRNQGDSERTSGVVLPRTTAEPALTTNLAAEPRRPSPTRSRTSQRSKSSAIARIRNAQIEAEERLAEIRKKELQIEVELIKKRLAVQVENIREEQEDDDAPKSIVDVTGRVNDWLQQQNVAQPIDLRGESTTPKLTSTGYRDEGAVPVQATRAPENERREPISQLTRCREPETVRFEESNQNRTRSPTPTRTRNKGIEQLAEAIEKMARNRPVPRQVTELPTFSGSISEWLPFKAAMRESTAVYNFTPTENMARLRNCLRGEAREAVAALLHIAGDPRQVMRTLEQCFGRPEFIIDQAIEDLKRLPHVGTSANDLNTFAIRLQNIVCVLKSMDRQGYLRHPMMTREVTEKLTPHLRSRWCDYAMSTEHSPEPEIVLLSQFLMHEADLALRFTYAPTNATSTQKILVTSRNLKTSNIPFRKKGREDVYTTTVSTKVYKCISCDENHTLPNCANFKKMNSDERWQIVKSAGLCFKCIAGRHRRVNCKAKACGMNDCRRPHHALLHAEPTTPRTSERIDEATNATCSETVMSIAANETYERGIVLLKVVPVHITGPEGDAHTFALLDEGSTISLIEEDLAKKLGAKGEAYPLRINGVAASQRQTLSKLIDLRIKGENTEEYHTIKLHTIPQLVLHKQTIPADFLKYEHLKDLRPENVCHEGAKPQLLIGADNWQLIVSRELRMGKKKEPAASLTELGWTIHGTAPRSMLRRDEGSVLHVYTPEDNLDKLIEDHFKIDSLGVSVHIKANEADRRAIEMFETTVKRRNCQFEVGLPWRADNITTPPSYNMALRRLKAIENRMEREPAFAQRYKRAVEDLLAKGYAEICESSKETSTRKWYLPHFPVFNPNKPGKLRLVFDAAAKSHGASLNDLLLEGPDLLQSLQGIMFRFREGRVAVTADIEEMFLRIKIRPEDQAAQMFLWRNNTNETPKTYKMTSLIFGATSSPFLAHSVRDRNAQDHEQTHPAAFKSITTNHYMDDLVESYENIETARKTINEVAFVHSQASFNLRGWNSNEKVALADIPEHRRTQITTPLASAPGKILGLLWDAENDELAFNTALPRVPTLILKGDRSPTKREALSIVMSVYDPLGLLSLFTIRAKITLQSLWRKNLKWDEPLPEEESKIFRQWLEELRGNIAQLRLPRWYGAEEHAKRELHIFCDASEQAYAAAAYWRTEGTDGVTDVRLAAAKVRVAPLKTQSIPRLELQAAVVGTRLAYTVLTGHRCQPKRVIYWSDSQTVLQWIRNDARRYTTFVAHRLGEISECTECKQWRWIPTDHNVADDATRLTNMPVSLKDRWFTGPEFLYAPEKNWPTERNKNKLIDEETVTLTIKRAATGLPQIDRFSSHERLIRATAAVLAFIEKCRGKTERIEVRHLQEAERRWIRESQLDSFYEEYELLEKAKPIPKSSRLYKLDPVIKNGIIRLNGRIKAADVSYNVKEPAILDGRHPYTRLLVKREHENAGHGNRERVVNDLRQRYWILKLRPTVRTIANSCVFCRIRRAQPKVPIFGDLPRARLDPYHRPFTNCGIDYFGPMIVTIGRRHEKRWIALFTCLTTRAVHLEIVGSLSTDSAIMAMRRMAAKRGWPSLMISDNATNFRGADAELRAAYAEWTPALRELGHLHRMTWRFIPPGAPNQGGAWERLVRSVKTALTTVLKQKAPKEEVLQTVLAEVEHAINARPLTHVSVDPADPEALTPNHFLLGSSTGLPSTGPCHPADRKTWRACQALIDEFWKRWVREYLPTLAPRQAAAAPERQLQVNDLVVIVDSTLPRNVWPRGVVERVFTGPDGRVRSADVRTKGGIFHRPTSKLVVLTVEEASTESSPGGEM